MSQSWEHLILKFLIIVNIFKVSKGNVVFILGGAEKIYLHKHPESPLLSSFEVFGCSGSGDKATELPSFPRPIFGSSLLWREKEKVVFKVSLL